MPYCFRCKSDATETKECVHCCMDICRECRRKGCCARMPAICRVNQFSDCVHVEPDKVHGLIGHRGPKSVARKGARNHNYIPPERTPDSATDHTPEDD